MKDSTGSMRHVLKLRMSSLYLILTLTLLLSGHSLASAAAVPFSSTVGVSYSRLFASSPLPAQQAMQQIKQSFNLVRFYDFDEELMSAAAAQNLEIILTVPNEKLTQLDSEASAQSYVTTSVVPWKDHVKTIIVGNEIFENNGQGQPSQIVTRMQNLVSALQTSGISNIPVTTNINLAVLATSWPVNQSVFQDAYKSNLTSILQYTESGPGFVFINIYPWFAIQQNPHDISQGYATFQGPSVSCYSDGSKQCQNLFEAQYLAWGFAVQALLPGNQTVAYLGETGWASAGGAHPELSSADIEGTYINGYVKWVKSQTPRIPSLLFEMYDEPNKPGDNQEPHWGLFYENGTAKFQLSNTNIRMVSGDLDGDSAQAAASAAADVTVNPHDDLVGVTADGQIHFALEIGNWQYLPGRLGTIATGDLTGDGRHEIVGLTDEGYIYYTDNLSDWQWVPGVLSQIALCDLNGDAREDLVGVTLQGQIYYTLDLENWQMFPGILSQLTCDDLNGDGSNDLAGITRTGRIYYTLDRENWAHLPGLLSQITSGHIDTDSKADLAGVNSNGEIFYTLNLQDWIQLPGRLRQVTIGKYSPDSRGHLIGFAADGSIYYTEDLANWQPMPGFF